MQSGHVETAFGVGPTITTVSSTPLSLVHHAWAFRDLAIIFSSTWLSEKKCEVLQTVYWRVRSSLMETTCKLHLFKAATGPAFLSGVSLSNLTKVS